MRIIEFRAENVKKLRAVAITPKGNVVQITGPNGSGKSSVLDAIYWALAGSAGVTSQPIRKNAEKATIRLDLGEVVVTRKFTRAGGTTLTVENAEGARFPSPQAMLDKLLGHLTFDPLEFARMNAKAQVDALKRIVPIDVDLDAIETANAADFERRRDLHRDEKMYRAGALPSAEMAGRDLPDAVDVVALDKAVQAARETLATRERWKAQRVSLESEAGIFRERAAEIQRQIETLTETQDGYLRRAKERENALAQIGAEPEVADIGAIEAQARAASQVSAERMMIQRAKDEHAAQLAAAAQAKAAADALTRAIDDRNEIKAAAVARAQMPVEGLAFGEGEILLNGIPFEQASSAEQLKVSVAIAMAANPQLRILRIKDGSLLDEGNLAVLAEMADAADFQIWIERVETDAKVGIIMEDGAVARAEDA